MADYIDPKTKVRYPSKTWMFEHYSTLPEVQKAYPDYKPSPVFQPKKESLVGKTTSPTTTLEDIEKALVTARTQATGIQTGISELAGKETPTTIPTTPTTPVVSTTPVTHPPAGTVVGKTTGGMTLYATGDGGTTATPPGTTPGTPLATQVTPTTPTTPTTPAAPQDYSVLYQTEYDNAGLGDIKTKIAGIDTDIANRKASRDQALLDEKGKPIPQWMITGRKALEVEAATGDLNRLIDERNTLAGQYNAGIEEVTRKVSYNISYQQEMQRQLETTRTHGLEEKLYELRKTEAEKPTEYAPTTAMKEWEYAGKPGTFEDWVSRSAAGSESQIQKSILSNINSWVDQYKMNPAGFREEAIKVLIETYGEEYRDYATKQVYALMPDIVEGAPENIDTYAYTVLRGEKTLTSVPDDIEPQVIARLEELMKTERVYTDEQIRAEIRSWIVDTKSKYEDATDEEISASLADSITRSALTDPDRERFNLILGEILPVGDKTGFWTPPKTVAGWIKGGITRIGEIFK